MVKYYFHIVNKRDNLDYYHEPLFADHFEADKFIESHESNGDTVINVAPYYEELGEEV